MTYTRDDIIDKTELILIGHGRTQITGCHCGWGQEFKDLGKSHARHVADVLMSVGLLKEQL